MDICWLCLAMNWRGWKYKAVCYGQSVLVILIDSKKVAINCGGRAGQHYQWNVDLVWDLALRYKTALKTNMTRIFGLPGHILGIEMHWFLSAGRRGCLLRGSIAGHADAFKANWTISTYFVLAKLTRASNDLRMLCHKKHLIKFACCICALRALQHSLNANEYDALIHCQRDLLYLFQFWIIEL